MANLLLRVNFGKHFENPRSDDGLINITSPTRKDNYIIGDTLKIDWTFDGSLTGHNLRVRLRYQSAKNQSTLIDQPTASTSINPGTYSFTIPAIGSGGIAPDSGICFIQLRDNTTNVNYETLGFSIGSYNKYYALETVSVDGYQWINKIINEPVISENVGEDKEYTSSSLSIDLDDKEINGIHEFRELMQSEPERFLYGYESELYDINGDSIRLFQVQDWAFDLNRFSITISDKYGSFLDSPIWDKYITENEFPDANSNAYDKIINYTFGDVPPPRFATDFGKDMLHCQYVNKSGTEKYLIGKTSHPIRAWSATPTDYIVYDPDGNNISASCTLVLGADGYYYINYASVLEYVKVYFYINEAGVTEINSIEQLGDILDLYENSYDLSRVTNYFDDKGYDDILIGGVLYKYANWKYIIDENLTGKQILKDLSESLALDYFINSDNEIVFKFLDVNNLTPDHTFQEGEILEFNQSQIDTTKLINNIQFNAGYDFSENKYNISKNISNYDSINSWGLMHSMPENYKALGLRSIYDPERTAKLSLIKRLEPQKPVSIPIALDKVTDVNLLDLISFPFPSAITEENRLYEVRGKELDYANDSAILELWDIERSKNIDIAQKFLNNSNDVDGSEVIFDLAVNGFYGIFSNNVIHDTSIKKYGLSSQKYNGVDSFLGIGGPTQHENLDIFNTSITTKFTLEGWFYFNALGSTEFLYDQYLNSTNGIYLRKFSTDSFHFVVIVGGVNVLALLTDAIPSANVFVHFLAVRDGSNCGTYINGVQKSYVVNGTSYQFNAGAFIGKKGDHTSYFGGNMDGFQINHNNKYNLSPNVGKTDSFTPPTKQQGFYKV